MPFGPGPCLSGWSPNKTSPPPQPLHAAQSLLLSARHDLRLHRASWPAIPLIVSSADVDELPNVILARTATQPLLPDGPSTLEFSTPAGKKEKKRKVTEHKREREELLSASIAGFLPLTPLSQYLLPPPTSYVSLRIAYSTCQRFFSRIPAWIGHVLAIDV